MYTLWNGFPLLAKRALSHSHAGGGGTMLFCAAAALAATRGHHYTLAATTGPAPHPAEFVNDGAWVNVDRWATNICSARKCGPRDASNCLHSEYPYSEGLSVGFIGNPELAGCPSTGCAPQNYGCWFTMIPAMGERSGAAVNVGRSLRANNRSEVARMLQLPCMGGPGSDCDQGLAPQDNQWCAEAQKRGFDSIQVRHPHFLNHDTELVVCTGCGNAALDGACPPLPLQRGDWDHNPAPCACNNDADNLNCGELDRMKKCEKSKAKVARLHARNSTLSANASYAVNATEKAPMVKAPTVGGTDAEEGDDEEEEDGRKCGGHQCRMVSPSLASRSSEQAS